MATTLTAPLVRVHWHHPEWVAIAAAAAGWLLLLAQAVRRPGLFLGGEHAGQGPTPLDAVVMSCAMMTLLVVPRVHDLAVGSLWRRRYRAVAVYLLGYLGAWSVATLGLALIAHVLVIRTGRLTAVATTAALAYAISATRGHARRVSRCHVTRPLAIAGWRADRDCAVEGVRMTGRCLATTWALMLALIAQHGLVAMAAASAVMVLERRGMLTGRLLVAWTGLVGILCVVLVMAVDWFAVPVLPLPHAH